MSTTHIDTLNDTSLELLATSTGLSEPEFLGLSGSDILEPSNGLSEVDILGLSEIDILGPAVIWTYLSIWALQGILAIGGHSVTILAVCKYPFLRENCTSRFVASLGECAVLP